MCPHLLLSFPPLWRVDRLHLWLVTGSAHFVYLNLSFPSTLFCLWVEAVLSFHVNDFCVFFFSLFSAAVFEFKFLSLKSAFWVHYDQSLQNLHFRSLKIQKNFFSVPELFESKSALLASSQCVFVFVCVCVHVNPGYFWVGGIQWKHSPECHKETNNPDRITSLLWTEGTWKSEYEYANRSQSSERLFEELLPLFPAINSTNNRLCLSVCHRP